MSDLSTGDVAILEQVEMRAWESMFAAAPATLKEALGLQARWFGPALATLSRAIDIGQFNRIQGLGLPEHGDGGSMEAAIEWFRDAGSKNFLIQIPPGPSSDTLEARAAALGLSRFRRGWTKFRRPTMTMA
jgi:hypothetical protein